MVAVNDITMSIGPGVTGLLGPNGAGKSTIMHMIAGLRHPAANAPSPTSTAGTTPRIHRRIGLVPSGKSAYAFLTGVQAFVTATAKLQGLA